MKQILKALLFTCLVIVACVFGCYAIYLWVQFASNLDVGYWMQLLICLLPGISILIVNTFLEFYEKLEEENKMSDEKTYMTDEEMIGILGALLDDSNPEVIDMPEKIRNDIYDVYAGLCTRVNQW